MQMDGMNGVDGMMGGWGVLWMAIWLVVVIVVLALAVYGLVRLFQDLGRRGGRGNGGT